MSQTSICSNEAVLLMGCVIVIAAGCVSGAERSEIPLVAHGRAMSFLPAPLENAPRSRARHVLSTRSARKRSSLTGAPCPFYPLR